MPLRMIVAAALAGLGLLLPQPWAQVPLTLAIGLVVGAVLTLLLPNLRPRTAHRFGPPIAFKPGVHRVVLSAPERDVEVLAEIRASLDIPLGQAFERIRHQPATVIRDVAQPDADELARRLRAVGATVTVSPH
ncbi:hypothetical protein CS0771_30580 [Catellatospora sp. IY07-71]|uniref:ribosomal protein L7/L12 n=1 Tax=Catellatospora sp. IY07-71 TaxID=2728827 RepID=UPI001BB4546F|nr:ribosomal protein L7/L12 [Catellatospora sp. IY07-71]BCJ73514.1 hypothetical protein CS0771_30580 [Catellatospora sp. IY07-71]